MTDTAESSLCVCDEDIPEVVLCKEDQKTVVIEVKQHTLFFLMHTLLYVCTARQMGCVCPHEQRD